MNKILKKERNIIIDKDSTLYLNDTNISITINEGVKVNIYNYVKDEDVLINVFLNKEDIVLNYYFSTINYNNHNVEININHNCKNTTSNFYNHGVNVLNNRLHFLVNGIIKKDMNGSICNQENQIINIKDGKSTICPNLLIDCFDVNSSHSAYIGKFSDEKIFYLTSRGLSLSKTYSLLMKGFLIPDFADNKIVKDYLLEIEKI